MQHQLRVLGLIPRPAGTGNLHGCDGRVILIPGTRHAEDMHYHPRSGLLFAACDGPQSPRFHWNPPAAHFENPERVPTGAGRGGLVVVNPKTFTAWQLALEGFTGAFVTQGIDIVDDPYDPFSIYIHAINHCPLDPVPTSGKPADRARSRIEVFRHALGSGTAQYIRSVYHPLVRTPNDLYSISPGEILVTNDHRYRSGAMRMLEDVVSHSWGPKTDLVRLGFRLDGYQQGDDVVGTIALSGLHNCNGLGHGPNGQVLLTDAAGGVLHVCAWDAYSRLGIDHSVQLDSTIDNPSYYASTFDSHAGYVLAGLARAYTLPQTNRDPHGLEPAIVWYVPLGGSGSGSPRVLFQDDGRVLRSASTAVIVDDEYSRERWLFVTGFHAEAIVAVKVEL